MARLARSVFPGHPHHVTQRSNGRAWTFFGDDDYVAYRDLLAAGCAAANVVVWAWVLMPNHVHLILEPRDTDGLRRALAPVHRRYAGRVHARLKWTGHFWLGRFGCVAMDMTISVAPSVTFCSTRCARDWWSAPRTGHGRASMRISARTMGVTDVGPVASRFPELPALLPTGEDEERVARLRRGESIGRPVGSAAFVEQLERESGRVLQPQRRGRRPKPHTEMAPAIA